MPAKRVQRARIANTAQRRNIIAQLTRRMNSLVKGISLYNADVMKIRNGLKQDISEINEIVDNFKRGVMPNDATKEWLLKTANRFEKRIGFSEEKINKFDKEFSDILSSARKAGFDWQRSLPLLVRNIKELKADSKNQKEFVRLIKQLAEQH